MASSSPWCASLWSAKTALVRTAGFESSYITTYIANVLLLLVLFSNRQANMSEIWSRGSNKSNKKKQVHFSRSSKHARYFQGLTGNIFSFSYHASNITIRSFALFSMKTNQWRLHVGWINTYSPWRHPKIPSRSWIILHSLFIILLCLKVFTFPSMRGMMTGMRDGWPRMLKAERAALRSPDPPCRISTARRATNRLGQSSSLLTL